MIALSRPFTLRHPWWSVVFLTLLAVLFCATSLLPVWGWIEVRFSPVQRFYLPAYLQSTVGVLAGSGPEYVQWIEKRAPGRAWEIAQPEDLVPLKDGAAPFELSRSALAQGWTELGYTSGGAFHEQETRDYLEANVFGGHSLLFLVLQPFALILAGWMGWKFFDRWRDNLARKRGLHWDPHYRPNTLGQDLRLFARQLAQESKDATAQVRRRVTPKSQSAGRPAILTVESATVSPSQLAPTTPPIPAPSKPKPKPAATIVAKAAEVMSVQPLKPVATATKPSQPVASNPQPVEAQAEPKPAPASPFGKPLPNGEPERKWDVSQWID